MSRASSSAAIVAILFAARIPNRVRQQLDSLDGPRGVIALNHQFATARALFVGAVLNHDGQTRAGAQLRGEWIVQQPPMTALPLEAHSGHLKGAVADIAYRESAIRAAACVHAAKGGRAGNRQLARMRAAGNIDPQPAGLLVPAPPDRRGLGAS